VVDILAENLDLGVEQFLADVHVFNLLDQVLDARVLDLGLVEQFLLFELTASRG
jgi:hypothetical protein